MKKNVSLQNPSIAGSCITVFLSLLRKLQKIDPEFPIQYAICLAEIAEDEGCSLTMLAERSGLALSTVSRITGALSDYRQKGEPFGFIEVKVSSAERRRKELYLTPLGRSTLKDILSALENNS